MPVTVAELGMAANPNPDTRSRWVRPDPKRCTIAVEENPSQVSALDGFSQLIGAPFDESSEALVPALDRTQVGVDGVNVGVGVGVGELVAVSVAVGVWVAVGVQVGDGVGVLVGVAVAVGVSVSVGVAVGVCVGVSVSVGVAVGVGVSVSVGVGVAV
jgi:hypothetical protein